MTAADLLAISRYVMPTLPLHPAKLGFLFGTRHGGATAGQPRPEADVIRVLAEYDKIPHYLQQDFLRELDGLAPYPVLASAP
jgi:hypothetical protein